MRKVPLYISFLLALVFALFGHIFFPYLRLSAFAPFFSILYNRVHLSKALWIAFGCGLIIDLISSHSRLGIYGLNFTLITALLYPQRKHFFEDKASALSLFSAIIAALSILLHLFLIYIFDKGIPLSARTLFSDVVLMSLLDGLYAFLWFTSPMKLYIYIQRQDWKNKEKSSES
jgi:rod shape-determining protein MreD